MLFITARTAVYSIRMRVAGVSGTRPALDRPDKPVSDERHPPDRPPRPAHRREERGGDRGRPRPQNPVILALDADGDGKISKEEIANARTALKALDKNGDDKLSREELRPPRDNRHGPGRTPEMP